MVSSSLLCVMASFESNMTDGLMIVFSSSSGRHRAVPRAGMAVLFHADVCQGLPDKELERG